MAMRAIPYQATGLGLAPPRVMISQGRYTAPRPGIAAVNRRFRSARLMAESAVGVLETLPVMGSASA